MFAKMGYLGGGADVAWGAGDDDNYDDDDEEEEDNSGEVVGGEGGGGGMQKIRSAFITTIGMREDLIRVMNAKCFIALKAVGEATRHRQRRCVKVIVGIWRREGSC